MSLLEKPPNWATALEKDESLLLKLLQDGEIREFVNRMNDRYLYWDVLKYRPRPKNISQELAWSVVKLSRMSQKKALALHATDGKQFGYWLPDSVLRELHFIDQNATGQILVDELSVGTFDRDRYIVSALMEEAIASSLLEGAATTRKKAKRDAP